MTNLMHTCHLDWESGKNGTEKNFISYSKTAFAMKNYYRKLLKLFFVLKLFACKMEKVLLCYNFCYIEEERQRMKKNEITLVKERRVKKLQLTDMLSFQFFPHSTSCSSLLCLLNEKNYILLRLKNFFFE